MEDESLPARPVWQQVVVGACILLLIILLPIGLSYFPHPVPASPAAPAPVYVKILAINDFHGQLPAGQKSSGRMVGSAPVLASYLKTSTGVFGPSNTIIAFPGDVIGASPPESGLLLDEPTLLFFNEFANARCTGGIGQQDSGCNMVATPGNHEFDRGTSELLRQVYGGNGNATITHISDPYPGALFPYTCTNVVWKGNSTTVFPPYVIRNVSGIPIAFIGADTVTTPDRLAPGRAGDVVFLNETASINRYVADVRKGGVRAIVVLLHEGGEQQAYEGTTREGETVTGRVTGIVAGLDPEVDVVLSGHTHAFTNAYLPNAGGKPVLVTQAYSYSKGFADVNLTLDPASRDIVTKTAEVVIAYADRPPGTAPDPEATAFLDRVVKSVSPVVSRQVAVVGEDITRNMDASGESALGDLLADAQRSVMKTDIAFITTGTMRADLDKGPVTWGDLFSIQPFSGTIVSMNLTGRQIVSALERQWQDPLPPHNLDVSGLSYTFDETKPAGNRVQNVLIDGIPLNPTAVYTAAMTDYLSIGGDGYTAFSDGILVTTGPSDVDTLASYLGSLPRPVKPPAGGRITKTG